METRLSGFGYRVRSKEAYASVKRGLSYCEKRPMLGWRVLVAGFSLGLPGMNVDRRSLRERGGWKKRGKEGGRDGGREREGRGLQPETLTAHTQNPKP